MIIMNKYSEKVLIWGAALVALGSSRSTKDTDYLVFDDSSKEAFIFDREANIDYINGNGNAFFAMIFKLERGNEMASPQSLLELKAYSLVQHCVNRNWGKVSDCEYDIAFLVRNFDLKIPTLVKAFVTPGQYDEITKEFNSVRK